MDKKDLLWVMTDLNVKLIGWLNERLARGTDTRIPPPPPPPPIRIEDLIRLREILEEYQNELLNLRKAEH